MSTEKEQVEPLNDSIDQSATEEKENTTESEVTTEETTDNSSEKSAPLTHEEQVAALNDKYLRLYSEFDNYRKRSNKEKIELLSQASAGVLRDMLSVLDDFDRAILNNEKVEDVTVLKDAFALIHTKLKSTLKSKGLKQMVTKGEPFDAELHEAIANIPAPSDDLKGKVVDDVERGYYLNEKVIRYAKVVVGQ